MERINLSGSPQSIVQSLTTSDTACNANQQAGQSLDDGLIDLLNQRMAEIYGHRWTSAYTRTSLDTWARGLAGLSVAQVRRGVNACIAGAHEWPPTLPEFRALCLSVPGLADTETAWGEALQVARGWKKPSEISHPVIWHALTQIGDFRGIPEETLEMRFRKNYPRACADFASGKAFDPIPQPLPPPSAVRPMTDTPECIAKREEALAKLERMFRGGSRSEVSHVSP